MTGVRAMMTIEGATDGEVFEIFLKRVRLRKLRPGDIVVLDNVGAHKTPNVRRLIEAAGPSVLFLPPYSPDLNPIELCWSKLKARRAMDLIGRSDAAGWFTHCSYQAHAN